MAKKDFSSDTTSVFDNFFSKPLENTTKENKVEKVEKTETKAIKKEVIKTKKETATPEVAKEIKKEETVQVQGPVVTKIIQTTSAPVQETTPKTKNKENRYNFFVDSELSEYVSNITWIKRQKNVATYMNSLIKQDLLSFLNLPAESTEEELLNAWNSYKENNNI